MQTSDPNPAIEIDPQKLFSAAQTLRIRIIERFPTAGLGTQAMRLERLVASCAEVARTISRPSILFRASMSGFFLFLLAAFVAALISIHPQAGSVTIAELLQATDSAFQVIIVLSLFAAGLFALETKRKRHLWFSHLSTLRALAHIIDLHQIDKDPDRLFRKRDQTGEHSPSLDGVNTPFLQTRYLDYSAELLAFIGKVAAYYGQHSDDPAVQEIVDDIEALTSRHRQFIATKVATLAPLIVQEYESSEVPKT